MDGVHLGVPGDANHFINGEISLDRPHAFAHLVGFIRLEAVHGKLVFLRVDRHRMDAEFRCRPEDADRNFRPVRDE